MEDNRKQVLANDKDISRQVPGILHDKVGGASTQELRNQELFYRATGN